jgi:hypothetical protein
MRGPGLRSSRLDEVLGMPTDRDLSAELPAAASRVIEPSKLGPLRALPPEGRGRN